MEYLPRENEWVIGLIKTTHPQARDKEPYWTQIKYIGDGEWEDHLEVPLYLTYHEVIDWIPKPRRR